MFLHADKLDLLVARQVTHTHTSQHASHRHPAAQLYGLAQVLYAQHKQAWSFGFGSERARKKSKALNVKPVTYERPADQDGGSLGNNNYHLTIAVRGSDVAGMWQPHKFLVFTEVGKTVVGKRGLVVLPPCDLIRPGSVYCKGIYVRHEDKLEALGISLNCELEVGRDRNSFEDPDELYAQLVLLACFGGQDWLWKAGRGEGASEEQRAATARVFEEFSDLKTAFKVRCTNLIARHTAPPQVSLVLRHGA